MDGKPRTGSGTLHRPRAPIGRLGVALIVFVLVTSSAFGAATASANPAQQAITWAQQHLGQDYDFEECLQFVTSAYSAAGIDIGSAYSAADYWTENPKGYTEHPGNTSPPVGALVFWGPSDVDGYSNPDGHVGIYVGEVPGVGSDEVISTWSWPEPESDPDVHYFSLSAMNKAGYPYDGWLAPAGETGSPGEGSFVSYAGNVYRIAGGAPLYINSWAPFDGPQPTTALSPSQWAALSQFPADGTTIRGAETGQIYKIAGGAPLYLSSCDAGCGAPINVSQYAIEHNGTPPSGTWHLNTVPVDGTTLRAAETDAIYKVAGGAPLYLNSCDAGCGSPVEVNQYTIDANGAPPSAEEHLNTDPADGTTLRAAENDAIYKVAGGAPLYLSSCDAGCGSTVEVNLYTIDANGAPPGGVQHLNAVPAEGTTLATPSSETGRIYKVAGGAPIYLSSCEAGCGSPVEVNQYTIDALGAPAGAVAHLDAVPTNGALIESAATGMVYRIAGGAPLYVSRWGAIGGEQPTVVVDQWDIENATNPLTHLNSVPANGTFIKTSSGGIFRIAGGAPFAVSSWSVFGGEQPYVTVDEWDIENITNPAAHLNVTPVNGTLVEGLPSETYWSFSEGLRSQVSAAADATTVDDFGLAAFPELQLPAAPSTTGTSSSTSKANTTPAVGPPNQIPAHGVLGTHATSKPKAPSLSIALAKCRKMRNRRKRARCEASARRRYRHRNKKEKR